MQFKQDNTISQFTFHKSIQYQDYDPAQITFPWYRYLRGSSGAVSLHNAHLAGLLAVIPASIKTNTDEGCTVNQTLENHIKCQSEDNTFSGTWKGVEGTPGKVGGDVRSASQNP